jgi:hypothetical protein
MAFFSANVPCNSNRLKKSGRMSSEVGFDMGDGVEITSISPLNSIRGQGAE